MSLVAISLKRLKIWPKLSLKAYDRNIRHEISFVSTYFLFVYPNHGSLLERTRETTLGDIILVDAHAFVARGLLKNPTRNVTELRKAKFPMS